MIFPRRRDIPELADRPDAVTADLPANLRDIRVLNRWFGGTRPAVLAVRDCVAGMRRFSLLDIATGSADIPLAIARDAARRGKVADVDAMDISPLVLEEARCVVGPSAVRLVEGDARSLPFGDRSYDVALCCLALHHFPPSEAETVLAEMWRVARRAVVIVDLRRSYPGYAGAWLVTRTVARNRLTRHDAPISVLRSYRSPELRELASRAGMHVARVQLEPFFRQSLVALKTAG